MSEPTDVAVAAVAADDPLREVRMEIAAIDGIIKGLVPLPPESRQKVWRYVTDWLAKTQRTTGGEPLREGFQTTVPARIGSTGSTGSTAPTTMITPGAGAIAISPGGPTIESFGTLAELFAAADPKNEAERALVTAVWLQEHEGQQEISPQTVNRELSHLGYRVLNITRAFDTLRGSKPQLVVQLRKDGTSKQARKTFKVTHEGKKVIERRLRGETDE